MFFVSTGTSKESVDFQTTLERPIPEPGHLWVPTTLPKVQWPAPDRPLWEFVNAVLTPLIGQDCGEACRRGLEYFPISLDACGPAGHRLALQLHLGPTKSFKDVGCRMAAELHRMFGKNRRVVVATSGDTGSAAAHAFDNICVLYPQGKVSAYQERQMLDSQRAVALAVPGDFDDCQRLAKSMLAAGEALSCNSVSLARLLPQVGIYAWAASRVSSRVFVVPSGNYGNAVACIMAKRMGAPIQSVHLACNANGAALVRYLLSGGGEYSPGDTVQTPATAMDVGRPSNAVRLFRYLDATGDVCASVVSTPDIRAMADKHTCPHTSCALHVALRLNVPGVVIVRTADAAKFSATGPPPLSPFVLHRPNAVRKRRPSAILLVGMPGVGKTTVSFMLGGHDSDCTMIAERGKKTLPEVIGEFPDADAFLEYEGNTVVRMLDSAFGVGGAAAASVVADRVPLSVIATGGSAVHSDTLRAYLANHPNVVVVWLKQDSEDKQQTDWSANWSARGVVVPTGTRIESPEQVQHLRDPLYAEVADFQLRTDVWDAERCAIALGRLWAFLA